MKLFNPASYPNFLDHLELNAEQIKRIIKEYNLQFLSIRDNNVEWKIKFPTFLNSFYKWIYLNKVIPNQIEFFEFYLSENKVFFQTKNFSQEVLEGLKARLFRTYPSLVRDVHFSAFVKEKLDQYHVLYNRKLDVEEGIDLVISTTNKYYGINLYTDTKRAHIGREKKSNRHTPFENLIYVELPVDFKGSDKCGNFFLYGNNELDLIKINISKYEQR
jgi:hypothetical protein